MYEFSKEQGAGGGGGRGGRKRKTNNQEMKFDVLLTTFEILLKG